MIACARDATTDALVTSDATEDVETAEPGEIGVGTLLVGVGSRPLLPPFSPLPKGGSSPSPAPGEELDPVRIVRPRLRLRLGTGPKSGVVGLA